MRDAVGIANDLYRVGNTRYRMFPIHAWKGAAKPQVCRDGGQQDQSGKRKQEVPDLSPYNLNLQKMSQHGINHIIYFAPGPPSSAIPRPFQRGRQPWGPRKSAAAEPQRPIPVRTRSRPRHVSRAQGLAGQCALQDCDHRHRPRDSD